MKWEEAVAGKRWETGACFLYIGPTLRGQSPGQDYSHEKYTLVEIQAGENHQPGHLLAADRSGFENIPASAPWKLSAAKMVVGSEQIEEYRETHVAQ